MAPLGPDSYNAYYADRPGETFNWSLTPMTDFPVMNMNRHSGPLLDVIKMAGICPEAEGITIDPKLPFAEFSLRLPLIGLAYLTDRMRGYYHPIRQGTYRFRVRLPQTLSPEKVRLNLSGEPVEPLLDNGYVIFEEKANSGERMTWEILPE